VSFEIRKQVGRPKELSPFERLARLRELERRFKPASAATQDPLKDGSWPVRKTVGRPRPQ
jgi:hypothetical protein